MGHKDITKVPQRSILWFSGCGYVTFKSAGHAPITQGTICKFLPPLVPKGQQKPPNTCEGLLFPQTTSKLLFALAPGPEVQAR